jgi:hypothetical protein
MGVEADDPAILDHGDRSATRRTNRTERRNAPDSRRGHAARRDLGCHAAERSAAIVVSFDHHRLARVRTRSA